LGLALPENVGREALVPDLTVSTADVRIFRTHGDGGLEKQMPAKAAGTKRKRYLMSPASVMPKDCQQKNDRQRHAQQPKQYSASKSHD
jgi:hypothetical protein